MENEERDQLNIRLAGEHMEVAGGFMKTILQKILKGREARSLTRGPKASTDLVPHGVHVIGRHPHLLPSGTDLHSVKRAHDRLHRMKILADQAESFARQVRDSVRRDEAFLYKTVLAAYSIASRTGGDALIERFVKNMRLALAKGPRDGVRTTIPETNSTPHKSKET